MSPTLVTAEMVGNIMSNHIGKGRYLNPHNFSKEICLEYNLGREALFPECDEISSSSSINLFAKRRLIAVFVILGVYP